MTDEEIYAQAIEFAKHNKVNIAEKLTDLGKYSPDYNPISVFMAGSPGAGKTEFSKNLINILEEGEMVGKDCHVVRIDNDDIRSLIPGYTGNNSHLFQGATTLIVEKMHDLVLHRGQNFILDNTFSHYEKAANNIRRSLEKARPIFIFYIYQKPEIAWKFTQAREIAEGRNIPKKAFIEQFLGARITINRIFNEFKDKITIFFVKKNFDDNLSESIYKIIQDGEVDRYIGDVYTKEKLEQCL